ncbi:MAG: hypothetical protein M1819_001105 [Sarea resinae]|nr:MAG: hypothetical protein M1819_001105 [Sarea resinae]
MRTRSMAQSPGGYKSLETPKKRTTRKKKPDKATEPTPPTSDQDQEQRSDHDEGQVVDSASGQEQRGGQENFKSEINSIQPVAPPTNLALDPPQSHNSFSRIMVSSAISPHNPATPRIMKALRRKSNTPEEVKSIDSLTKAMIGPMRHFSRDELKMFPREVLINLILDHQLFNPQLAPLASSRKRRSAFQGEEEQNPRPQQRARLDTEPQSSPPPTRRRTRRKLPATSTARHPVGDRNDPAKEEAQGVQPATPEEVPETPRRQGWGISALVNSVPRINFASIIPGFRFRAGPTPQATAATGTDKSNASTGAAQGHSRFSESNEDAESAKHAEAASKRTDAQTEEGQKNMLIKADSMYGRRRMREAATERKKIGAARGHRRFSEPNEDAKSAKLAEAASRRTAAQIEEDQKKMLIKADLVYGRRRRMREAAAEKKKAEAEAKAREDRAKRIEERKAQNIRVMQATVEDDDNSDDETAHSVGQKRKRVDTDSPDRPAKHPASWDKVPPEWQHKFKKVPKNLAKVPPEQRNYGGTFCAPSYSDSSSSSEDDEPNWKGKEPDWKGKENAQVWKNLGIPPEERNYRGCFRVPDYSDSSDSDEELSNGGDAVAPTATITDNIFAKASADPLTEKPAFSFVTTPSDQTAESAKSQINPAQASQNAGSSVPEVTVTTPSESMEGSKSESWTQPPPPRPTPAHASLPSDALARARSQAEKYKPKQPSGLRASSRLSTSTVGSDIGDEPANGQLIEPANGQLIEPDVPQLESTSPNSLVSTSPIESMSPLTAEEKAEVEAELAKVTEFKMSEADYVVFGLGPVTWPEDTTDPVVQEALNALPW